MDQMITIKVDEKELKIADNLVVSDVLSQININKMALHYIDDGEMVDISFIMDGQDNIINSYVTKVYEGMVVVTENNAIREHTANLIKEQLSKDYTGISFPTDMMEEIRKVIDGIGLDFDGITSVANLTYIYSTSKLIKETCELNDDDFIFINVIPSSSSIQTSSQLEDFREILNAKDHYIIALYDNDLKTLMANEFNNGTMDNDTIYRKLRGVGFNECISVDAGSSIKLFQDVNEFMNLLTDDLDEKNAHLPLVITSSQKTIDYLKDNHPQLSQHLSQCKLPYEIEATLIKQHYARKGGLDNQKVIITTITEDQSHLKMCNDLDYIITYSELKSLLNEVVDTRNETIDKGILSQLMKIENDYVGVEEAFLKLMQEIIKLPLKIIRSKVITDGITELHVKLKKHMIYIAIVDELASLEKLVGLLEEGVKFHLVFIKEGQEKLVPAVRLNDIFLNELYRHFLQNPISKTVTDKLYQH